MFIQKSEGLRTKIILLQNALLDNLIHIGGGERQSRVKPPLDLGEIVPLDGKQLKEFKTAWSKMHVYGVKKKGFMLHSDKNNDVKILLQIMPNGDLDKEIGVAAQHINPVYKEGQWYLTLYDPQAEGVYDIFDESNTKGNVGIVKQ